MMSTRPEQGNSKAVLLPEQKRTRFVDNSLLTEWEAFIASMTAIVDDHVDLASYWECHVSIADNWSWSQ